MKRSKLKLKKQYFQLLEIMVALLLIVGCAVPVMHIYFNMYKQQDGMAREYEIDHTAHLLHAKVVERLYQNSITFDELSSTELVFEDEEVGKELAKLGYTCTFTLKTDESIRGTKEEGGAKRQCDLLIKMNDLRTNKLKEYDYILFIAGGPHPEKWKDDAKDDDQKKDTVQPGTIDANKPADQKQPNQQQVKGS